MSRTENQRQPALNASPTPDPQAELIARAKMAVRLARRVERGARFDQVVSPATRRLRPVARFVYEFVGELGGHTWNGVRIAKIVQLALPLYVASLVYEQDLREAFARGHEAPRIPINELLLAVYVLLAVASGWAIYDLLRKFGSIGSYRGQPHIDGKLAEFSMKIRQVDDLVRLAPRSGAEWRRLAKRVGELERQRDYLLRVTTAVLKADDL